jgi:hypothetical protein
MGLSRMDRFIKIVREDHIIDSEGFNLPTVEVLAEVRAHTEKEGTEATSGRIVRLFQMQQIFISLELFLI